MTKTMTHLQLRKYVLGLSPNAPITESFDRKLAAQGQEHRNPWWTKSGDKSHKKHWLTWLADQSGPGYKNRKSRGVKEARSVYNHINCPPMLLWLIEASKIRKPLVKKAEKAALQTKKSFPSQSAAIRKVVPWEMVELSLSK
jgi:hypothetical protein